MTTVSRTRRTPSARSSITRSPASATRSSIPSNLAGFTVAISTRRCSSKGRTRSAHARQSSRLLPDPASLGPRTKGKTNIGCIFTGTKDGQPKTWYIYNVCDHEACYREVGSQAISYTTGVPAMCGALMMLTGQWNKPGVYTVEEFDPDPFLDALDKYGLPRSVNGAPALVD